jgi:hypothetical protein
MKTVIVLAEDYDRTLNVLKALDALGVTTILWNVSTGALVSSISPPKDAIYFSRQSPSASTRNHGASIPYVRNILWWLQAHGCRVINGLAAFEMEMSKMAQMALLHLRGINTPRTKLASGVKQLWVELSADARSYSTPVLIKPDTGGSGMGIEAYGSPAAAADNVRSNPDYLAAEGMWIIQEHVNAYTEDESRIRSILRFEIVDGKVLYIMQIRAPATEFKLCPCDPKMESILSKVEFRIITNPYTIPCFKEHPEAYDSFVAKLEGVWTELGAKVGSAEAFLPIAYADDVADRLYSPESQLAPTEPVVFEINFNSNYNQRAEELVGIDGAAEVARMLQRLAAEPDVSFSPIIDL